jgi:inosose dehydratase
MKAIIGTQMYPWLQHFHETRGKYDDACVEEAMQQSAAAGLGAWEQSVTSATEAEKLGGWLKRFKLKLDSIYAGGDLHTAAWRTNADSIIQQGAWAKTLGAKIVTSNPNPLPQGKDKTDEELRTQAAALNYVAKGLRDIGMTLAYHTHDPEMRQGSREFHHMMLATRESGMKFCLDSHWIFRGLGSSNVGLHDVVDLYGDRIVTMHLRQSRGGIWSEHLGEGDIDYAPIVAKLRQINFNGPLIIETAFEKGTPRTMSMTESHRKSREWVERTFGV